MEGLAPEQKSQAIQMLNEERDSFSQSEEDIGVIKDLESDIKLKDDIPIKKLSVHSASSLPSSKTLS